MIELRVRPLHRVMALLAGRRESGVHGPEFAVLKSFWWQLTQVVLVML